MKKGFLISIEGIDGCGKSTLAKNLYTHLMVKNIKVLLTKEPGQTAIGEKIKKILYEEKSKLTAKTEFLLFASSRAQHFEEVIIPHLKEGFLIISDRMGDSSLAYQGFGLDLDINTLKSINSWAMNNIEPDLTIYIRLELSKAFTRMKKREEKLTPFEKKDKTYWEKVIKGFETIFSNKNNVLILDGNKSPEELLTEAITDIETKIKK